LSEDNNPVIIEYKKVESSELINQSLFYLAWLHDHHGDFAIAVQKSLGNGIEVDWTEIRVICIAPNYRKYDLHAVQMMGANIELWTYRLFANNTLYIEEVLKHSDNAPGPSVGGKNPVMVAAGKKAAATRATAAWTTDKHLSGKSDNVRKIAVAAQEYILGLNSAIEESAKKLYIAYRTTQNIVCMEVQQQKVVLFVKLDPSKHLGPPGISRDVSSIGHYGTGNLEITLKCLDDLERAKPFLQAAYETVGG
jgi:predicted transport protein